MIISHYFFNWLILDGKAEIQKKIVHFLVQMKTLKFASEIYWPLVESGGTSQWSEIENLIRKSYGKY